MFLLFFSFLFFFLFFAHTGDYDSSGFQGLFSGSSCNGFGSSSGARSFFWNVRVHKASFGWQHGRSSSGGGCVCRGVCDSGNGRNSDSDGRGEAENAVDGWKIFERFGLREKGKVLVLCFWFFFFLTILNNF